MKNARSWLAFILGVSLLISLLQHQMFSGAYIQSTSAEKYTYFIGVVSTTIPFAFWALVTFAVSLIRRGHSNHLTGMICGYLAGWTGMTLFTFWIVSWPQTLGHSSTIAIAVGLTPFLYAAIFPVLFPCGYFIARVVLHLHRKLDVPAPIAAPTGGLAPRLGNAGGTDGLR